MKLEIDEEPRDASDPLEFRPDTNGFDQHGPGGFAGVASSIGTKNLLIAIITMPFVFLLVVMTILAVFGGRADEPAQLADAATAGAVRSTPAEAVLTIEEPAPNRAVEAFRASTTSPEFSAPLAAGGAMALDGDRLAVRVDRADGAYVVVYDLAAGEVIYTVPLSALGGE